jgi:hypothetical protein
MEGSCRVRRFHAVTFLTSQNLVSGSRAERIFLAADGFRRRIDGFEL